MNEMFGLGILLNARDQASASILRVDQALTGLVNTMHESGSVAVSEMTTIQNAMTSANAQIMQGLGLTTLGNEISNFGESVLSTLYATGSQVISTGSQFEQWRMTLKALYKDVDVANQKLQWGMDLATKTPFEVSDITRALIGFKAVGAEADTMFEDINGGARSFLEYMGDLAALRPDVGLQGVLMGVRNLLGGDGGKSLRMRMDIDFEQILGKKFGESTEEIMQDLVDASQQLANGLMKELEGTWEQMISNLQDQSTRLFLGIADNGAFDSAKQTLKYLSDAIGSIDDDRMKKISTNIANAFSMIWKPIDMVAKKIVDLGMGLIDLIENNPFVAKLVVGITTLTGVLAIALGTLVAFAGGFLIVKGAILLVKPMLSALKLAMINFGATLLSMLPTIALVGGAIGLLALAWKNDFGGVRSALTNFMTNTQTAFKYSSEIASMGVSEMMNALNQLDTNTWYGNLTYKLVKIKVFWMGLVDAWNDYTLSDENFQKLRELGLLPLLQTILDIKLRAEAFFEGFKQGWRNISETVKPIVEELGRVFEELVTFLFPVKKGMSDINAESEGLDITPWVAFGEAVSYISGFALAVFAVVKGIGFIITVVSTVASFIGGVVSAIGGFLSAVGGFVTAVLGFFGLVVSLPAWAVGAIVVGIGAIIGLAIAFWDEIVEGFKWVGEQIRDFFSGIPDFFEGVFEGMKEKARPVLDWFGEKFGWIGEIVSSIGGFIGGLGSIAGGIGSGLVAGVKGLVGLNTGGYVKEEGVAMLHPNEVVVNDDLTQKLRVFLDGNTSPTSRTAQQSEGSTPNNTNNSINFSQGAIQITMTNGNDADIDKLVKKIADKLQRETQLRSTLNYRPSLG